MTVRNPQTMRAARWVAVVLLAAGLLACESSEGEKKLTKEKQSFLASFNSQQLETLNGLSRTEVHDLLGRATEVRRAKFQKPTDSKRWFVPVHTEQWIYRSPDEDMVTLVYFDNGRVVFAVREWGQAT